MDPIVARPADSDGVRWVEDRPASRSGERFVEFDGETVATRVVSGVGDDGSGFAEFPLGEFVADHLPSENLNLASLPAHRSEGCAPGQPPAPFQRRRPTERDALHAASR